MLMHKGRALLTERKKYTIIKGVGVVLFTARNVAAASGACGVSLSCGAVALAA
jgi:hypothetical protein